MYFDKLVESAVKYADYLQENLVCVKSYQSSKDSMHNDKVEPLPLINIENLSKYSKKREIWN